uniref:C-repeat binding factor 1 n=1 Tax=Populus szechuanica var. tibetica TaxID=1423317 RepID=A0A1C9UL05_9ROSI|nr:C-repeat binding factor 1 [Populus szechuanica var. tibetica]
MVMGGSNSFSPDKQESSLSSLLSDSSGSKQDSPSSNEKVLLATSRPKKRAGRRIFKETRHPIFRGVRKRNGDKWVCELREPNKKSRIWLGTYPTPEMAARAHDVAALAFRGKSACLNFADSAWRLPVPISNEAKDIRRAASEAAELFRTSDLGGQVMEDFRREDHGEVCSSTNDDIRDLPSENVGYIDEEVEFNMPGLLASMAEGLLLSPPHYTGDWNDGEIDADWSLWSS